MLNSLKIFHLMESVAERIALALSTTDIETRRNVIYQIQHDSPEEKTELKALLKQGDIERPHTVASIDFVCKPIKLSRKQRAIRRMTGTTPFGSTGPSSEVQSDGAVQELDLPVITIYNSPIYIYGKYIKRSRSMTQSPLVINGDLRTPHSVSDFISEFQKFFASEPVKFMACGREDVDVRCTGGRPFVLEIPRPRKNLCSKKMNITLHEDVDILDCCVVDKSAKDYINSDASSKTYSTVIFSSKKILFEPIYHLKQKTPLRVLHRRANMIRERDIQVLESSEHVRPDGYYYYISIRTSSGTYVKEWVNGDFGRSVPSLDGDLLALDVTGIEKKMDQKLAINDFKLNVIKRYG